MADNEVLIPFIEERLVKVRSNPKGKKRVPRYRINLVREGGLWVHEKNLNRPHQVYEFAAQVVEEDELDREALYVICLDQKNRVIGVNLVALGHLTATLTHAREVFKTAVLLNAASVIVFHNHPSGVADESKQDVQVTRALYKAGEILGINMLDHVIVGDNVYTSIMERHPDIRGK